MRIIRSIDNHAVSPVLGLVLAFAIIVGGIGVVQQFFVPVWLKNEESMHYFEIKRDFEKLDEKIVEAANYGTSVMNMHLEMIYPKYPFLITPGKTSSSITIEKIGEVQSSLLSKKVNITAFVLEPRYNYINVQPEIMILGEYFAEGSDIGGMDLYQNGKLTLLIFDSEEKTLSGNAKIVFDGFGSYRIEREAWFNISVKEGYEWYVKHLMNVLSNAELTFTADEVSYRWINFTVSPDTEITLYFAGTDTGSSERTAPVRAVTGGFNLTRADGSSVTLADGGVTTVDLSGGHGNNIESPPAFYITGTTLPNTGVNVSITYEVYRGENSNPRTTLSQNFVWYSDSNGVFQLPIVPPAAEEENSKTVATVQLTFPDGSTVNYTIDFIFGEEGHGHR